LGTVAVCALAFTADVRGQNARPNALSPHETSTAIVDGAQISLSYGRPRMRGRKIFGSLVPYDRVWMPGADEATLLKTSASLRFKDFTLPAGSYTLYTMPTEKSWTLIINKRTGQFHTIYPEDQDLAKLAMTVERLAAPVEQLTIQAVPLPQGGGAIQLEWETTRVFVPFVVVQ
jgi:hypothetical protein